MNDAQSTDLERLKKAWQKHEDAIRTIRTYLAKQGSTIEVEIVIRDKAASERRAKRVARVRR